VLLTTTTTIAGLIPMMTMINFDFFNRVIEVGSVTAVWWVQLSTAIIFGLGFSTILTLIMIPTMLALPTVWMRLFSARRASKGDAETADATAEPSPAATGPQLPPTPADATFGPRVAETPAPANVTPIGKKPDARKGKTAHGGRNDLPQAAE
jgi:multidrug efflux pump